MLVAIPFDTVAEAIEHSNATTYGLGAGVWTRDVGKAHAMAARLRSGIVWINTYGILDPAVPIGGVKMSGYGKDLGIEQLDEYLSVKSVWIGGMLGVSHTWPSAQPRNASAASVCR